MQKHFYAYDFPIGRVYVAESDGAVTDVSFSPVSGAEEKETQLLWRAAKMLTEYFDGKRTGFEGLPLRAAGTAFQEKAWRALMDIPYGQTRSYKEQAVAIGNEKACRAVGAANGKNPISIIIPCHRVVGSDSSLTGYGGGLGIKKALLELERKHAGDQ